MRFFRGALWAFKLLTICHEALSKGRFGQLRRHFHEKMGVCRLDGCIFRRSFLLEIPTNWPIHVLAGQVEQVGSASARFVKIVDICPIWSQIVRSET